MKISKNYRGKFILLKGGTTRFVIVVDVGLIEICTLIVCEAYMHVKHTDSRGSRCPKNLKKLHTLKVNVRAFK